MIDGVLEFLGGRTADVRARVRDMMLAASEREDYERARDLRDTLRWVEQLETPQPVEVTGAGDADVIGYARDGDDAVGVTLRVRDGRVVAREHRFLENLEDASDEPILSAFLVRYYLPTENRARRVVLPFLPADSADLEQLLPGVEWIVPQRGRAHRLLTLADQNARHLMESLRIESFETEERAEDPVYSLGRDLGMNLVPRSMICIDISTNQGRDTVGSLVWFEAGRPKKSEYRKFRIKGDGQQDDFAAIQRSPRRGTSPAGGRRASRSPTWWSSTVARASWAPRSRRRGTSGSTGRRSSASPNARKRCFFRGRRRVCASRDGAPPSGCSSGFAMKPIGSASPTAGTGDGRAPSPRSFSTFPASVPPSAPACWSASAAWPGVRSASAGEIAALPGFSVKQAEIILRHLKGVPGNGG